MVGVMNIKRCGGCHFAKIINQDLTKRLCHGAPPSAIQIPTPNGQMRLQMARPVVQVTDEACSMYQAKTGADEVRDNEAVKAAYEMAQAQVIKQ